MSWGRADNVCRTSPYCDLILGIQEEKSRFERLTALRLGKLVVGVYLEG